jgi:hypothetical protein
MERKLYIPGKNGLTGKPDTSAEIQDHPVEKRYFKATKVGDSSFTYYAQKLPQDRPVKAKEFTRLLATREPFIGALLSDNTLVFANQVVWHRDLAAAVIDKIEQGIYSQDTEFVATLRGGGINTDLLVRADNNGAFNTMALYIKENSPSDNLQVDIFSYDSNGQGYQFTGEIGDYSERT